MENNKFDNLELHDPKRLLGKMPHAFEVYFDDFGINWIKQMTLALAKGKDVLELSENDQGSFFYQFTDFHAGAFNKDDLDRLDPNLREFCEVCGKIESITDSWPILEQEPSDEDKKKLNPLISKFLQIIPTKETFDNWVKNSLEHFSN